MEQHPTEKDKYVFTRRFEDMWIQMVNTATDYMMKLEDEIIRSQAMKQPTYVTTDYVAKNIIERFIRECKVPVDKRILMGVLGGTTEELMDTILQVLKRKDPIDEDYTETIIAATLVSSLWFYFQTKNLVIINFENIFKMSRSEKLKMLKELKFPSLNPEEASLRMIVNIAMQFEENV
jgi:hypothetical protein